MKKISSAAVGNGDCSANVGMSFGNYRHLSADSGEIGVVR
jgi:hypothetical protein